MTAEEQIKRIENLLVEADFIDATKDELYAAIEDSTIAEIKESIWKLYCFMSDVCDTLNM